MKKILYIASIMFLGAVACTRETEPIVESPVNGNKGMVAVTMGLRLPVELTAQTKAGETDCRNHLPKIDAIRVAVFGTSSYPQAYAVADPVNKGVDDEGDVVYTPGSYASTNDVNPDDANDIYYFKVLLPVYEGRAVVHIVANGDKTIPFVDQTEYTIMSDMVTTDDVGGYWARIVLEDGILAQTNTDGIMKTDDDGNYIPSDETARLFEDLVLVRNFAEIKLIVDEEAGLTDVTWALVNDPVNGSIAPMADGEFVQNYKDFVYDDKTAKMVICDVDPVTRKPVRDADGNVQNIKATYTGYMVNDALKTLPSSESGLNWQPADVSQFSYERVDPNKTNPTYIMMKGKFTDGKYYYYRVDLMDENVGGYFPLFRNYMYQIKIDLVGNAGATTYTEAAKRNSGGNVSMSAETQTLTDVSDGFSRLFVQYVEKTFTSGGQKSFWAYYVPHVNQPAVVDNSTIEVSVKEMGTALANADIDTVHVTGASVGLLDVDKVVLVTVTLKDQSMTTDLSSVLQVKAHNDGTGAQKSTLYRDVTLKVMKKMDMILSLSPNKVGEGTDKKTVLHITLKDTLQQSMFPLEFYIEDTNRTLNPTGKNGADSTIAVPVKRGTCLFDDSDKNSYSFVRTVNWDEYEPMLKRWKAAVAAGTSTDGIIDFTTQLKTIKENGATKIYVDNEYFNMDDVDLSCARFSVSTSLSQVSYKAGSASVTISTDDNVSWTATVDNGAGLTRAAGTTTITGTGTETFTINYDENTADEPRTITVTVTSDEGFEDSASIVQRRAPASPSSFEASDFSNRTADSEDGYLTVSYGNGFSLDDGYLYASGRNNRTITFTPLEGVTITEIIITYYNQNYMDTNPSFNSGNSVRSGATVTWTGNSANAVTYTCGTRYSYIESISVKYN